MRPATLYARNDARLTRAGLGLSLLTPCTDGQSVLIPTPLAEAITSWEGLKSLEQHVQDAVRERHGTGAGESFSWYRPHRWLRVLKHAAVLAGAEESVRQRLGRCVRDGVLISGAEIESLLRGRIEASSAATIKAGPLAFVTRDRPALLRRCLTSYVENAKGFGRDTRFLVIDDSLDADASRENRATVESLRQRNGIRVEYFGVSEATEYKGRLMAAGDTPPDVLRFALFGEAGFEACGANRNRLLLRTVGERPVSVDDDTLCDLRGGAVDEAWALETADLGDLRFFRDRASALSAVPTSHTDFMGLYEGVLGQDPAALIAGAPSATIRSQTLDSRTLTRLLQRGAAVRYCMPGLAGDCGTWAPQYLMIAGPSRERLLRTENEYGWAIRTREIVRCVPRYAISAISTCMAYAIGLDNTAPLPPFLPLLRNSDGLFGSMLGVCDPRAFKVDLPYAIVHDPPPGRSFGDVDVSSALHVTRVAEVVSAAIRSAGPFPTHHGPERRIRTIGIHLCEIASAPLADFEEMIREAVHAQLKFKIQRLERLRAAYGDEPRYWADHVRCALTGMHSMLTNSGPVLPVDLRQRCGDTDCRPFLQEIVRMFGRLLTEWEGIRETARKVNEER